MPDFKMQMQVCYYYLHTSFAMVAHFLLHNLDTPYICSQWPLLDDEGCFKGV